MDAVEKELSHFDLAQFTDLYLIPWGLRIVTALLVFFIGRYAIKLLTKLLRKVMTAASLAPILINFSCSILSVLLLLFVIAAALDQLGVDTTSLIAVFGAAGLAIGLALQDSLKNFAAGVLMVIFQPFRIGHYIEAAGVSGTVEKINIFSTELKTPDNKEITIPNGAIYGGNIINYSVRPTRRVDIAVGIGYGDDLRKAKELLQKMVDHDERVLADPPAMVAVTALAESSVNLVARVWVNAADYWPLTHDMNEQIKLDFDANGISIPYPQMEVHLSKAPE